MAPSLAWPALWAWLAHTAVPSPVPVTAVVPPVDVEAPALADPASEAAPESPLRRDATGQLTVVEASPRRGEALDVAGLLAAVPGINFSDAGGFGQARRLSLRGAASNGVLVLLDGAPLSLNGGGADLSRVPLAAVERVEVLRGGGGRYAPGALGGVVNVVTRTAARGESGVRAGASLMAGAFDTQSAELHGEAGLGGGEAMLLLHGGRSRGNFSYRFDDRPTWDGNASVVRERENNQSRHGGALLRYRREVGGWSGDGLVELLAEDRGLAGTVQNPTPDAQQATGRLFATVRASRLLGAGRLLSFRAHGMDERSTFRGGMFGAGLEQRQVQAGLEGTLELSLGSAHQFSASVQVGAEGVEVSTEARARGWGRLGALLVDDIQWGAFTVSPSVRVDQSGPFTTFSPKLGAGARLPLGLELRANAGQSARAPSFSELYVVQGTLLPNAALRPERGLVADAGVGQQLEKGRWNVAGYHALYEDLIAYELYPPFLAKPFNFAAARAYGVEADGEWRPAPWLSAAAGYTLTLSENLRDDPRYYGRELPYRPRHRAWGRVVGGPEWLKGRAELLAQSGQVVNRAATVVLPARAFVNVGVSATPLRGPDVTVSAELKNLLDVQGADLDGYPLPGRAAYVTVSIALDAGRRRDEGRP
jgi:iron complex outermembrane receptor protein